MREEECAFSSPQRKECGLETFTGQLGNEQPSSQALIRGMSEYIKIGYLLHSPNLYRLWFRVGFDSGLKRALERVAS
jgi:hypothetical protein